MYSIINLVFFEIIEKIFLKYNLRNFLNEYMTQYQCFNTNFIKYLDLYKKKLDLYYSKIDYEFLPIYLVIGSIGNYYTLESLILANRYKLRKKRKIILIIPEKFKPNNRSLFFCYSKYFKIIQNDLIFKIINKINFFSILPLGIGLTFKKYFLPIDEAANFIEQNRLKKKYQDLPVLNLTRNEYSRHLNTLKRNNISLKNKWIVTIHVREPGFRGENYKNTTENFRNSNPLNYVKAAKAIIKAGGIVFRMGHKSNISMPKISGLIDYANSDFKSEELDVFLASISKFCIGNSSGFMRIARAFGVPVLLADGPVHIEYFSLKKKDLYLPRLFYFKKNKKLLKFKEMFKFPYNSCVHDKHYEFNKVSVKINTPEEILQATNEMIRKVFRLSKKTRNTENSRQTQFKKIVENAVLPTSQINQKAFCDISNSFLSKYSKLL